MGYRFQSRSQVILLLCLDIFRESFDLYSGQEQNIDFTINKDNLCREESVTDLKAGYIRRLVPIKLDGTDDPSCTPIFVCHAELMSKAHNPQDFITNRNHNITKF